MAQALSDDLRRRVVAAVMDVNAGVKVHHWPA